MTTALRQRMLQDLQLAGLSERTHEAYRTNQDSTESRLSRIAHGDV
jgi:hypothetical protein